MLLQLKPEEISKLWGIIKPAVLNALPVFTGERQYVGNGLLNKMLIGQVQCWVSYRDGDLKQSRGIMTTTIVEDEFTGTRNLLLYTAFAFEPLEERDYLEGFKYLKSYCAQMKCENVICYTENERLLQVIKRLNGMSSYHLCVIKMKGE